MDAGKNISGLSLLRENQAFGTYHRSPDLAGSEQRALVGSARPSSWLAYKFRTEEIS
jgi:hypothetical protein